jgi:uncharacterized delta-60 repeat protein
MMTGKVDCVHKTGPLLFSHVRRRFVIIRVLLVSTTLIMTALVVGSPTPVATLAGNLDPGFGTGGKVTTTGFSIQETGILSPLNVVRRVGLAVQSDLKVVAAGELEGGGFGVVRFLPDGSSDDSFGMAGRVTTFGGSRAAANTIVVQPDGKIVVGGFVGAINANVSIRIARYLPDGSLDPSFNGSGAVTSVPGLVQVLALQPDGKLVWAGFGMGRYLATGAPDPSFAVGCAPAPTALAFTGVAVQSDGKLLVGGGQISSNRAVLARFSQGGCLDDSFGMGGIVFTDCGLGPGCMWTDIALQADGKVVATGPPGGHFMLARYLSDGTPDSTFGISGRVTSDFSGPTFALALRTDGKIQVLGSAFATGATTAPFALARYNPDGTLDSSFGSFGQLTTDFGGFSLGTTLALQSDGKFVAAGVTGAGPGGGFPPASLSLARYLPDSETCPVNTLAALPPSQSVTATKTGDVTMLNPMAFRRFRDQRLAGSAEGRRLTALYNAHSAEVTGLLLKDRALRASVLKGLLLWQSHVAALADDPVNSAKLSPEQERAVDEVVDRLAAVGSVRLRRAIEAERRMQPPGLSLARALLRRVAQAQ